VLQGITQRRLEERRQLGRHRSRRRRVLFKQLSEIDREMKGGFASKKTKLSAFVFVSPSPGFDGESFSYRTSPPTLQFNLQPAVFVFFFFSFCVNILLSFSTY
jgi:hypothetical protein